MPPDVLKVHILLYLLVCSPLFSECKRNFQKVHVLDPSIDDFKYYESWNSDKWTEWLRLRCAPDISDKAGQNATNNSLDRICGTWVNIIIISSKNKINAAFSKTSTHAYTSLLHADYFWSDVPFHVFVILRSSSKIIDKRNITSSETSDNASSDYKVYSCLEKLMFMNARLDMKTFEPLEIKTFFPKKVTNPKDTLRIPLTVCKKVTQVRGLIDEIKFKLGI